MSTVSALINNQPTISANTIISADQVNITANISRLTQALNNLLDIVQNQLSVISAGNQLYDHSNSVTYINNRYKPNALSIITANELNIKRNLINAFGKDCICYADCTQFARWKYYTCQCNSDCGCNYYSIIK